MFNAYAYPALCGWPWEYSSISFGVRYPRKPQNGAILAKILTAETLKRGAFTTTGKKTAIIIKPNSAGVDKTELFFRCRRYANEPIDVDKR